MSAYWLVWMQLGVSICMGISLSGFLVLLTISSLAKTFPEQIDFANPWMECDPSYPTVRISFDPPTWIVKILILSISQSFGRTRIILMRMGMGLAASDKKRRTVV